MGRVEAGSDYIYSWTLAEGWTLYGSKGYVGNGLGEFSLLPDEPTSEDFDVWSTSIALGTELSARSTLYIEWYGLFSAGLEDDFSITIGCSTCVLAMA